MHSDPRRPPSTPLLARRTLIFGAGAMALVATAGCNPFVTPTKITQTVTKSAAPVADPLPALIGTTRLHVVRLTNAIARDKTLTSKLVPLRADRRLHLAALIAELGRTSPQAAAAERVKPTTDPSITVPAGGSQALVAGMRSDATLAQTYFTDAFPQASPYRAALFGSIIACLATHRVVLT